VDIIPIWVQCAALTLLLFVSAFFSITETSMMALNRYRLKSLVRQRRRAALIVNNLLSRTDRLLGMVLIGNNLSNAAASALVTEIAISHFGDHKSVVLVATAAIGFLIIVFAEIAPKVVGAAFPDRLALSLAYVLKALSVVFFPVVWFVNLFTRLLLRPLRIPMSVAAQRLSPEELRTLVLESGHFIPKKQTSLFLNLLDLEAVDVADVMTPRPQIEAIDLDDSIETITEHLATSYHNTLPVYEGEINRIRGILTVRKCLALLAAGPLTHDAIRSVLAAAYFIPPGTSVTQQLQFFQEKRQRMGIVVDEYGDVRGLVTLEDIVEEIVGELAGSMPRGDAASLNWDADGTAIVDGSTSLRDINRRLGLVLPLTGPNTLNGLILEELQDIPDAGVALRLGNCAIEILQVQNQAVRTARLMRLSEEGPPPS